MELLFIKKCEKLFNIESDKEYWESTGLVNHDFAPCVELDFVKKIFAKLIFFVLRNVMK